MFVLSITINPIRSTKLLHESDTTSKKKLISRSFQHNWMTILMAYIEKSDFVTTDKMPDGKNTQECHNLFYELRKQVQKFFLVA